jgi:hypothetical protein
VSKRTLEREERQETNQMVKINTRDTTILEGEGRNKSNGSLEGEEESNQATRATLETQITLSQVT